ncbi:MAG: hypothetical protein IK064_00315 [Clostridia bacterium]|nr:hypothetical protein [Clostridia bacterium]MBR6006052.1 hypothetical protein [Clostridia bacterium]
MNKPIKNAVRFAAVLLIAALAVSLFAACGANKEKKPEELILGKWETVVDFSTRIKTQYASDLSDMNVDLSGLDLTEIKAPVTFEFNKDGTYTSKADEKTLGEALDSFVQNNRDMLIDLIRTTYAKNYNMDVADVTDEMCFSALIIPFDSWDSMLNGLRSFIAESYYADELTGSGSYELKDGKLTMDKFMNGIELGCEVGDETLTISLPDGAEGLEPGADSLFPIVLNKAK